MRIVLESPLAGDFARNQRYARLCVAEMLRMGHHPFAGHLLYVQCLDDMIPEDRRRGMEAGFAWGACAEACWVYTDLGISPGMKAGIERWQARGIPVEYHTLPADLMAQLDGAAPDLRPTEGSV